MAIELVKAPYVGLLGQSQIDYTEIQRFAAAHGLKELEQDPSTPIGKFANSADTDTDLLAEFAGRFCYRAWGKGRSTEEYLANILNEKHGNVIAHPTYHFIVTGVSRSLTHELIRHHVGTNPSQESQRYVTADTGEIEVVGYKANRSVVPPMILQMNDPDDALLRAFEKDYGVFLGTYTHWLGSIKEHLKHSNLEPTTLKKRATEAARWALPNASETRLVWTMNARAARWIIEQRGDEHADLEIRRLAVEFTKILTKVSPNMFSDAQIYMADDGFKAVSVEHSKV